MPSRGLSLAERERLSTWPQEIARSDLAAHFTLTRDDVRWLRANRAADQRVLALAVLRCGLEFLGTCPRWRPALRWCSTASPRRCDTRPPRRLPRRCGGADPTRARRHGDRPRPMAPVRSGRMENDPRLGAGAGAGTRHPSLLFGQVLEQLRRDKIVRPGLDRLTRAVAAARTAAIEEIHHRLAPQLPPHRCQLLDTLLVPDPTLRVAALVWLFAGATSASPESIKGELAKLAYLRELGADRLDLNAVPPERRRQLAAVRGDPPRRPYAIWTRPAVTRCCWRRWPPRTPRSSTRWWGCSTRPGRHRPPGAASSTERRRDLVAANLGRLGLLDEILDVVLDPDLDDDAVGAAVRGLGHDRLAAAVREHDERTPGDGGHLKLVAARYAHVRSFAPQVLGALSFSASVAPSEVLDAVTLLQAMNAERRRHVPPDAPLGFIPARWRPYLDAARAASDENLVKHYWELCVLFALQAGLRSGEIWVARRAATPTPPPT